MQLMVNGTWVYILSLNPWLSRQLPQEVSLAKVKKYDFIGNMRQLIDMTEKKIVIDVNN